MQIINNLDLVLLNGTMKGDRLGEFTFVSTNGASTIDYAIISQDLIGAITDIKIDDCINSDHLPLVLEISLGETCNVL